MPTPPAPPSVTVRPSPVFWSFDAKATSFRAEVGGKDVLCKLADDAAFSRFQENLDRPIGEARLMTQAIAEQIIGAHLEAIGRRVGEAIARLGRVPRDDQVLVIGLIGEAICDVPPV